jgi:hypothetical protein
MAVTKTMLFSRMGCQVVSKIGMNISADTTVSITLKTKYELQVKEMSKTVQYLEKQ